MGYIYLEEDELKDARRFYGFLAGIDKDAEINKSREFLPGYKLKAFPIKSRLSDSVNEERCLLSEMENVGSFEAEAWATDYHILRTIYMFGGIADEKMILAMSQAEKRVNPELAVIGTDDTDSGNNIPRRLSSLSKKGYVYVFRIGKADTDVGDNPYSTHYYSLTAKAYDYMKDAGIINRKVIRRWGLASSFNCFNQLLANRAVGHFVKNKGYKSMGNAFITPRGEDFKRLTDTYILNANMRFSGEPGISLYIAGFLPESFCSPLYHTDKEYELYKTAFVYGIRDYIRLNRYKGHAARVLIVCPDISACTEAAAALRDYKGMEMKTGKSFIESEMREIYFTTESIMIYAGRNNKNLSDLLLQAYCTTDLAGVKDFKIVGEYADIFAE